MGFFSFIETFFFISLIITFVLLVMLIYHFKQRILKLEDKTNTLVEIVNDIVKEIKSVNSLGNITNNTPFVVQSQAAAHVFPSLDDDRYDGIPENIKTILIENHETDSDSESESEYEVDDESEESDSGSDSEDDDDAESVSESKLIDVSIPELEIIEDYETAPLAVENTLDVEDVEPTTIKTISIDLGNDVLESEVVLTNVVHEEELNVELELDSIVDNEVDPEPETIVEIAESNPLSAEVSSNKKVIYENMAPSALKSLIVQRGLTSVDVSKMKKNKLVQILVDSDE